MSMPKLKKHDNGVWYVVWTEGRRSKRESTGAKESSAAKAYLAQFLLNSASDASTPDAFFTVAELWSLYDAKHVENIAAPDGPRNAWKNLSVHFGEVRPHEINQNLVDAYTKARVAGKIGRKSKPATVRKELAALRAGLNWCADPSRKIIKLDQVPHFELPPEGEPRDRWLRTEEIQRLLTAAGEVRNGDRLSRGERFLWLALETGGRKTAILELTWDRVDFDTNVIHLNVPGRVVTKKRRANVPISKALRPVLKRAYDERISDFVLDNPADIWVAVQIIAEHAGFGAPDRPTRSNGAKPARTGISPHVLRHTAATHMARRGVPLWKIAKVLGNTLAMIEKTYAKHSPEDLREAVNMISGASLVGAK